MSETTPPLAQTNPALAPVVPTDPDAETTPVELTPDTSDVPPVYMAVVAPDDPQAVMDVVALVPANKQSTVLTAFRRVQRKWEQHPQIIDQLRSATPPPVVKLDQAAYDMVLEQMEGGVEPLPQPADEAVTAALLQSVDHLLTVLWGPDAAAVERRLSQLEDAGVLLAAGGTDRNRGNAERLRRYWTRGEGALKIRWGTPGDWKRCVRHLSKYLGVRAKGYCQLRHKEATGVYTGSRLNPGKKKALGASGGHAAPAETYAGAPDSPPGEHDYPEINLEMSLAQVFLEYDDSYQHGWEPPEYVVMMLRELASFDDTDFQALVAAMPPSAYNIDKNRKNAERLRRYWTRGKGAGKIRWNTGGDWKRCVRYLSKYLGPRAKGYCALRHKEVTGLWTGDQAHRKMYGWGKSAVFSNERLVRPSDAILDELNLAAKVQDARERVGLTASAGETGATFVIPLVIPEEHESGDGRMFRKDALNVRELPLPLLWQIKTGEGHMGSVVVGRIDSMERVENGIGNARGVFDTGAYGAEAERLVRNGFIRGVSADLDKFEAEEPATPTKAELVEEVEAAKSGKPKKVKNDKLIIDKARIMAVTIVPKPAFQECTIALAAAQPVEDTPAPTPTTPTEKQEDTMIPNGIYVDRMDATDAEALVACGIVASSIPVTPPAEWFDNPKLDRPIPLTVTDDGRVYGHIAAWHVDHIGMAFGTRPPRSRSKYAYVHTGVVRADGGIDVPVGQLTLAGGHAGLEASASDAVKHYDDTASAVADVHAGEDGHGIWVAGALRPGVTPEQVRTLRASAPSGDWRPIKGSLELVAVCQVNVPGFPIARARVASGQVMALVAAGAAVLAKMKSDPVTELAHRLERLENTVHAPELQTQASELATRVRETADLNTAQDYDDQFAFFSRERREKLAKSGKALPDGSFPIVTANDLENAVKAYGRARDKATAKRHIMKRARALGKLDLIPDDWKGAASETITASVETMRARVTAAAKKTK